MADEPGSTRRIVVGVDGSESSVRALVWALDQARATGAAVEAIQTWEVPTSYGTVTAVLPSPDLSGPAGESLAAAVDRATEGRPEVTVTRRVLEGQAAAVLVEQARDADLLVVGSRGHGGFAGALLGSVSLRCVQHAPCPVVVVRP